jgi:hypothetical protein
MHDFIADRSSYCGVDEIINTNDADFGESGLKTASVFRLTRLAVVSDSIFTGLIGEISATRLGTLKTRLAEWIKSIRERRDKRATHVNKHDSSLIDDGRLSERGGLSESGRCTSLAPT